MTSREFCYFLQGMFELCPDSVKTGLTSEQTDLVRRHLALVFTHEIDPSYSKDPKVQEELNKIHNPKPYSGGNPGLIRC